MTDDITPADRAYLCHVLRTNARSLPSFQGDAMVKAADEIERLAKCLAQSDAETDDFDNRDPNERVSIPRIEILNRDKRITELEAALSQSNAEPVAWRETFSNTEPVNGVLEASLPGIDDRPPPRPNVSATLDEIAAVMDRVLERRRPW